MQTHGPKRVYTPQSLEFWFGKLEHDWERHFSEAQLEEGHRIYRDGEVRELELTASDAIIHRRIEKKDEYAVIEWTDAGVSVRSSSTDINVAHSLAVAGLHEIEELVADEISPLPDDQPPAAPAAAPTTSGHGFTHGPASHANGHAPAPAASSAPVRAPSASRRTPAGAAARAASRTLILVFTTTTEGLTFQANWVNPDKKRVPALGQVAQNAGQGHATVSSSERAKLIGLAAYARKAHFAYNQVTGLYVLGSVVEIPNFLKVTLPAWKKLFAVELDAQSSTLLQGTKEISVEAVATTRKGKSEGQGLDLRWIFKAGERLLTDEEVSILTKKGTSPVIIPSIGIVSLPIERLASISAWHRTAAEARGSGELSPYLIFSLYSDSRVKLTLSPELEAWRQNVLTATAVTPVLPELLRPYQRRGVEWLHHLCDVGCHGLLADEMGLGKTLQVLTLLASRPQTDRPSVIVCPASVVPVWREEILRFYPHLAVDVLKTGNDFTSHKNAVIWLASYTQLRKHRTLLSQHEFSYAVLDEGQFIKNPDAKVTQTCFAIRARHRIVLTGTPLENRQLDLWSIFRFLLPGLLGSRVIFETALTTDRSGTLERLRAQLAPFILRRTKNEVATELPQKVEIDLICPLTEVQRAEYAKICSEGLNRLGDDVGAAMREKSFGFLALLTRLRQVCCDPDMLPWMHAPLTDSGKITLLIEKLAEVIGSGHKVVIFSQFVMLLDRVRAALIESFPDLPRYELTGMTLDRLKPVQSFQNAEGAAAMLVSLKAAGTGITLHAADYVFLLDPWWNPAVEAQAVDRVHRIGQKSTVFVYRMVTAGTIEERIQALQASKKDLFNRVVGGLGGDFDLSRHFSSLHELVQLTETPEETEPGL
ncbi:MAG: serine/threonine protein kinase [Rariglobus sp.]|jgi:superfamily II DNA or RNA helicase|nr:serine/threonine protein kinase [Rariglobus sp.]